MADELSKAAYAIKWSRPLATIAVRVGGAGKDCRLFFSIGDLMDMFTYERPQLYKLLSGERPSWARAMRKLLDSHAPPAESDPTKTAAYEASRARERLRGMATFPGRVKQS